MGEGQGSVGDFLPSWCPAARGPQGVVCVDRELRTRGRWWTLGDKKSTEVSGSGNK